MARGKRKIRKHASITRPVPLGYWAMGGPFMRVNHNDVDAMIDEAESTRTTHRASNVGTNFFTIG